MKYAAALAVVALAALFTGCGDSATEIQGTLPVVTGITIDQAASSGDTVVVTWSALDTTLVDGYFLWHRPLPEGLWYLAETCTGNAGTHTAFHSDFYTVTAYKGTNTSSDLGLAANTRSVGLEDIRKEFSLNPVGFQIDIEGDSLIAGDPSSENFAQEFVVAIDLEGQRYIFPGTAHGDIWPGGRRTAVSSRGGFVAPAPDDSLAWQDSIPYGGFFFLALDSGYFCMLRATHTFPDTSTMTDTLVLRTQLQPIRGLRVFNQM